jgi:TonB-linked SusC/RagA family outer membrane protein
MLDCDEPRGHFHGEGRLVVRDGLLEPDRGTELAGRTIECGAARGVAPSIGTIEDGGPMHPASVRVRRIGTALLLLLAATAGRAWAQNAVIRGTVRSDLGEFVEGASVLIPELGIQTATTPNGGLLISVPAPRVHGQAVTLVVRMIGFRPWRQTVTMQPGEQVFDIRLAADVNRLSDIVVTGVMAGTPQTQTTFSVARVDLTNVAVPAADPLSQLAGQVPGLNINTSTGRPGATPDVLLRGPKSINATGRSQDPLYIVDGVILGTGAGSYDRNFGLLALNPQDIENIEIVRGAAGASLYGAQAANGVINITTKSGRTGVEGMTFRLRSEAGFNDIERAFPLAQQHPLLMDPTGQRFCTRDTSQPLCARTMDWTTEVARVNNAAGTGAAIPAGFAFDPGVSSAQPPLRQVFMAAQWPVPTYDPARQVLTSQPFVSNNIDVTGRMGGTRYFASASQLRQGGAVRMFRGQTRYTARLNVDQQIGASVSLSFRTFYSRGDWDGWNNDGIGIFYNLRQPAATNLLARDTLGRLYALPNILAGNGLTNPLSYSPGNGVRDLWTSDRFVGGATLHWAVTSWADLEANFSLDRATSDWDYRQPKGFRGTNPTSTAYLGYLADYANSAFSYNSSVNLTLRQPLGRDLTARWQFRWLLDRQDAKNRQMQGGTLAVVGVDTPNNATTGVTITGRSTSERLMGLFAGVNLDYRQKLIGDFLLRRDGSSLFGAGNRWATFGRASLAYRPSQESWWPFRDALNEFKLRASYGTAGGRPSFAAQYETYDIGAGGALNPGTMGNRNLRPEINTERELGADLELFRRIGVALTYAHSDTKDQILLVPAPATSGFTSQWGNAGTLTNRTWELSVNVPIVRRRDLSWSWRFNYDWTRTVITRLDVPPFRIGVPIQGSASVINIAEGERYGTIYGTYFLRGAADCVKLPAAFQASCGTDGAQFQVNSDGWLVWTGGYGVGEGVTRNMWMTQLPAASSPWGFALNWGLPVVLRDSTKSALSVPLGSALPDWRFSVSQTLQFRRLTVYAMLEGVVGRALWNYARQWAYMDLRHHDVDQRGKSPEDAKPIGYYWRAAPAGLGGLYQALSTPTNDAVEDVNYAKLRELSVTYRVGQVAGVGNWDVSLIARNLFTLTNYRGQDPETGVSQQSYTSQANSGLVNAIDAYAFPTPRTFTIALSTSF